MNNDLFWEMQKISGCDEYNKQIDEKRKREEENQRHKENLQATFSISEELRASNKLLQQQIDEAKKEANIAKQKSFWASFRAWLSIGISIVAVIASFVIAKFF